MPAPDIDTRPIAWSGLAVAATVATAIGVGIGLMHAWHEPLDGAESGAASLLTTLRATGPALQSAPQDDAAAHRNGKPAAASGATR